MKKRVRRRRKMMREEDATKSRRSGLVLSMQQGTLTEKKTERANAKLDQQRGNC